MNPECHGAKDVVIKLWRCWGTYMVKEGTILFNVNVQNM